MTVAAFADGGFTVRDGLRLHYRDYPGPPAAPVILCLHGLTRNARDFAAFAERYASQFRVVVLEFRGRGQSDYDPVPTRYVPMTYAGDVIELLDHIGVGEAIFVGTSLGGLVTMAVAAMGPECVAGSILNDVGPELNAEGLARIQSYLGRDPQFASWEEAAAAIAHYQGVALPDYRPDDWLAMAHRNCREENGSIRFDYDPAIVIPFQTAGPAPTIDLWPLFAAVTQKPLLVLRGALSDLLSEAAFEAMRAAAPGAHFVTVPRVGHAPDLGEPEAVAAIDAFLADFLPSRSRSGTTSAG